MEEGRLATKDWKKAIQDAIETLEDRVRSALDALAPRPQLVPVPVGRPTRDDRRRRE